MKPHLFITLLHMIRLQNKYDVFGTFLYPRLLGVGTRYELYFLRFQWKQDFGCDCKGGDFVRSRSHKLFMLAPPNLAPLLSMIP